MAYIVVIRPMTMVIRTFSYESPKCDAKDLYQRDVWLSTNPKSAELLLPWQCYCHFLTKVLKWSPALLVLLS